MRCLLNLTVAIAAAACLLGCEAPSDNGQTAQAPARKGRSMPGDMSGGGGGGGGNAAPGSGPPGGGGGGKSSTMGTITSPGGMAPPQEGPGAGPPGGAPGAPGGGAPGGGKGGLTGGGKGGLTGGGKGGLTGGAPGGAPGGPPGGGGTVGPPADGPQGGPPSFDPDAGKGPVGGQPAGGKGGLAPGGGPPGGGPPGGPVDGGGVPGRPGMGAPGTGAGAAEAEAAELTMRDKSMQAFRNGKEDDAFQYMYAYYLTDNEAKDQIAMGYLPAVEEPRAAVRWGVSLEYIPQRNFEGAPPRIGADPNLPDRGGDRGGPGGPPGGGGRPGAGPPGGGPPGGGFGGNSSAPSDPTQKISYYLGEFGEFALNRLEQRMDHKDGETSFAGFYGDFLASVEKNTGNQGDPFNGGRGAGGSPRGGFNPAGGGGGGKGGLGGVSSPQGGPPGDGPPGGSFGPPAGGGPVDGGRGGNAGDDSDSEVAQLMPGVLFLGEGKETDMLDRARDHGVDALLHFTVKVSVSRADIARTDAKVELFNVKTRATVYNQRRMFSNIAIWKERERNNDAQPVKEELDKVFTNNADEVFRLQAMPQLSAEDVKKRIDVLTASAPENPLPALSEVKYYYDQELIDETAVLEAFTKLGCQDAENLANGTQEQKEKAISQWMPGNFDVADDNEEFR